MPLLLDSFLLKWKFHILLDCFTKIKKFLPFAFENFKILKQANLTIPESFYLAQKSTKEFLFSLKVHF